MAYLQDDQLAASRDRLASETAPHLARGPWLWEPGPCSHYGTLQREEDGLALILSLDAWKKRARFRVEGPPRKVSYGRSLRDYGVIPYGEPEPACTVALDRPGASVAGDIQRKVLAIADPLWPAVLAKAEEEAGMYAARDRAAAALGRLTNAEVTNLGGDERHVSASVRGVWLSMRVGPGGVVTLPRLSVTQRQMEAVIAALRFCDPD